MTPKLIKVIGITATVIGMAASLVGELITDKKMDLRIAEKVSEALNNK